MKQIVNVAVLGILVGFSLGIMVAGCGRPFLRCTDLQVGAPADASVAD